MQYLMTIDKPPNDFIFFGQRGDRRQYVLAGNRLVIVSCQKNIRLESLPVSSTVFAIVGNDNGLHVAVPENHVGQFHTKITITAIVRIGERQYIHLDSEPIETTLSRIIERAPIGHENSEEEIRLGLIGRQRQAAHNAGITA